MNEDRGEIVFEDNILDAGFVQIPALVVFDGELSPGAKTTYAALLWYGWKFREFPGQTAMAEDIGATDRTVRRHLTELEEKDYIRVEQLGLGRTNRYVIRSLRNRPIPDRTIMSGLAGHNRPVKADINVRSHRIQDSRTQTHKQQQQLSAGLQAPANPTTVVVALASPLTANDLTARLVALGVTKTAVRKLLKEHDASLIYRWVAYTEHRLRSGWAPKQTPAAWLVSAVRSGDWTIPDWFKTPEEEDAARVERVKVAAAERRRLEAAAEKERQAAEEQRAGLQEYLGVGEREEELWDQARALLQERQQMSASLLNTFLLPMANGIARIATPIETFCPFIEARANAIRSAIEEVTGLSIQRVEVRFAEVGERPAS